MSAAIFSAVGRVFNVESFLVDSTFREGATYWKVGEGSHTDSGFQIVVSEDEDVKKQVAAYVLFIRQNLPELKKRRDRVGLESIDFRVAYFWEDGVAALAYTLPEELHLMLAQARATLTFCVYPCSEEEPNQIPTDNSGAPPLRV